MGFPSGGIVPQRPPGGFWLPSGHPGSRAGTGCGMMAPATATTVRYGGTATTAVPNWPRAQAVGAEDPTSRWTQDPLDQGRLTQDPLFSTLDPSDPGLGSFKKAVGDNDYGTTRFDGIRPVSQQNNDNDPKRSGPRGGSRLTCEDCEQKRASFGLRHAPVGSGPYTPSQGGYAGTQKIRWCGACSKRHPGAQDLVRRLP